MPTHPETIGPYRILDRIGRGGMGIVYRAEHRTRGTPVALKTLTEQSESLLAGFRREIHALARINHPGIVRILHNGVHEGGPWYAMELIEGPTLREFTRRAISDHARTLPFPDADTSAIETARTALAGQVDSGPPEISPPREDSPRPALPSHVMAEILGVVQNVCSALAFLHGEGIVHRDLKPDNILVQPSGQPVLVDFGVASFFAASDSREALIAIQSGWGTVNYMAPEQVQGLLVDARADLYALGCILYELLTGKAPFAGHRYLAVAKAHMTETPVPPSHLAEGIPKELDDMVLRLLAKQPRDRIGYAEDVAVLLARAGATPAIVTPAPRPQSYLYRPGLVGRESVLGRLQTLVGNLDLRKGGIALIGGESGVGKTRLVIEIGREWEDTRVRVLTGECPPIPAHDVARLTTPPLAPLRRMLRAVADRCIEGGEPETERLLGPRLRVLAVYEPDFLKLEGSQHCPDPEELPAEAARLRVFECLADTLAALAERSPVLLILDDLQWADELTIGFLRYLLYAETVTRVPLFVLGVYRSDEVHDELRPLVESDEITCIHLDRLSPDAVSSAIGEMLAMDSVPEALSEFIGQQSEGNPFFIAEYLRAAVDEGLLRRDLAGTWRFIAGPDGAESAIEDMCLTLPVSLRELIGRRLTNLPDTSAAIVAAAAVVGRESRTELLGLMSGLPEAGIAHAVTELLRRQVFDEPSPGLLRFAHDRIRELAYDSLDVRQRESLHLAAATHLPSIAARTSLAILGRHWEAGGNFAQARGCYLAGARRAFRQHAYSEAERLYRAYLALVTEPDTESVTARNELGYEILRGIGRGVEGAVLLRQSLDEARRLGNRPLIGFSLRSLASVCKEIGRVDEARQYFGEALAIAEEIGDRHLEGTVLSGLCLLDTEQGRAEDASPRYERAVAIARELGDRDLLGRILTNLAFLRSDQGRSEESIELCSQALALIRETGNRRMEGIAVGNLAVMSYRTGHFDAAIAEYREALAIHREVGNRRFEGVTLVNLAVLHYNTGRADEAATLYRDALAVLRQAGDRRTEGVVLTNLGQMQSQRGFIDDARAYFDRATAIHQEVENRRMEAITFGYMALMERRAGRLNLAGRLLDRALALLGEIGDAIFTAVFLCERGHLELARGRRAAALLEEVERRAASLSLADHDLIEATGRLRRAVAAFESSLELLHGECPEDVPRAR